MCLPKSQAQNKIWTHNPLEIHCVNLFNRLDCYSGIHFKYTSPLKARGFMLLQMHTDPSHAHTHMYMYSSGDSKALSTGGGMSDQNRRERQTRLPFSKLCMYVFLSVWRVLTNSYRIHTHTVTSIQILMSRTECSSVN